MASLLLAACLVYLLATACYASEPHLHLEHSRVTMGEHGSRLSRFFGSSARALLQNAAPPPPSPPVEATSAEYPKAEMLDMPLGSILRSDGSLMCGAWSNSRLVEEGHGVSIFNYSFSGAFAPDACQKFCSSTSNCTAFTVYDREASNCMWTDSPADLLSKYVLNTPDSDNFTLSMVMCEEEPAGGYPVIFEEKPCGIWFDNYMIVPEDDVTQSIDMPPEQVKGREECLEQCNSKAGCSGTIFMESQQGGYYHMMCGFLWTGPAHGKLVNLDIVKALGPDADQDYDYDEGAFYLKTNMSSLQICNPAPYVPEPQYAPSYNGNGGTHDHYHEHKHVHEDGSSFVYSHSHPHPQDDPSHYRNPEFHSSGYQSPDYYSPGYQNPDYYSPGYQNPGYYSPGYDSASGPSGYDSASGYNSAYGPSGFHDQMIMPPMECPHIFAEPGFPHSRFPWRDEYVFNTVIYPSYHKNSTGVEPWKRTFVVPGPVDMPPPTYSTEAEQKAESSWLRDTVFPGESRLPWIYTFPFQNVTNGIGIITESGDIRPTSVRAWDEHGALVAARDFQAHDALCGNHELWDKSDFLATCDGHPMMVGMLKTNLSQPKKLRRLTVTVDGALVPNMGAIIRNIFFY